MAEWMGENIYRSPMERQPISFHTSMSKFLLRHRFTITHLLFIYDPSIVQENRVSCRWHRSIPLAAYSKPCAISRSLTAPINLAVVVDVLSWKHAIIYAGEPRDVPEGVICTDEGMINGSSWMNYVHMKEARKTTVSSAITWLLPLLHYFPLFIASTRRKLSSEKSSIYIYLCWKSHYWS